MNRLVCKVIFILFLGLTLAAGPAAACVGKTLIVGSKGTVQQDVLAQVLSLLISERTGTSVKIVKVESTRELHEAMLKDDVDIAVEYTGAGLVEILDAEPGTDAAAAYDLVKERYNSEHNLVWLKPLGFAESAAVPEGAPSEAAPLVRKGTLKKFPALARLINKLGGTIDDAAMADLEASAGGDNLRQVARDFLKKKRLI
ncbi:MAG: hypothetical protein GWO11_05355 [Desulfuromonadales bacterium]|nr:hypothetical protein [Desulfuromonadales bacterium]NIR33820.1 hypothetical protein [Desulfuromonadales bacterium]NIS41409.1 hypothetical protein [Desulfuromonadales bacterium]